MMILSKVSLAHRLRSVIWLLGLAIVTSFAIAQVNGQVNALAIQSSGEIVVGGTFTQVGEKEAENLARYGAKGEVDEAFVSNIDPGVNGSVFALAVQPDGRILLGGNFSAVSGQPRRSIARLNPDGTLDSPATAETTTNGRRPQ